MPFPPSPTHSWKYYLALAAGGLAGVALPISNALANIAVLLMVLAWLASPQPRETLRAALRHPFIRVALLLYGGFLLAVLWSPAEWREIGHMLGKLRVYLLAPLLLALCTQRAVRRALLLGFAAAVLLSLVLSLLSALLGMHLYPAKGATVGNWYVFHNHTEHSNFIALLCVALLAALLHRLLPRRWTMAAGTVIALGAFDVFYLVQGRTAQGLFVLMAIVVLLCWNLRRGLICSLVVLLLLPPLLWWTSGNFKNRILDAQGDVQQYQQDNYDTSLGQRLTFYRYGWAIVRQSPWWGHGTGSLAREYAKVDVPEAHTTNPHNDYLWFWIEIGIAGPLGLLGLLYALGRAGWFMCRKVAQHPTSPRSEGQRAEPVRGSLILALTAMMAAGTLANSFFTDNVTGAAFMLLACALLAGPLFPLLIEDAPGKKSA